MSESLMLVKGEQILAKEEYTKVGWEKTFLTYHYNEDDAVFYVTNKRLAIVSPEAKYRFWGNLATNGVLKLMAELFDVRAVTVKNPKPPANVFTIPLNTINIVRIKTRSFFIIPTTEISIRFGIPQRGNVFISFYWEYGFTNNAKEFISLIGRHILDACRAEGATINSIDEYDHILEWKS